MTTKENSAMMEAQVSKWQTLVRSQILLGIVIMSIYFYCGFYYLPIVIPDNLTMADRLIFTLRWAPIEILPVAMGILVIGIYRGKHLHTAGDPSKPEQASPPGLAVHVRFLANTVEQVLIHLTGLFAFATYVQPENLKLIPLIVILFFVGRMLYWIGYANYPFNRALGLSFCLIPSMFMLCYSIFCLVRSGADLGIRKDY